MNNAFYISLLAGLSTLLGSVFLFIKVKNDNNLIGRALAFASGVMVSVSILDLIPTAFKDLIKILYIFPTIIICFIFIIIGILILNLSNKLFPDNTLTGNSALYKTGIFSMLAIVMHNIPEGCIYYVSR